MSLPAPAPAEDRLVWGSCGYHKFPLLSLVKYSNSYTVRNRSGAAEITIYATGFCLPTASIFVFGCGCSCGKLQTPLKWRLWLFEYLLSLPKWNYFCRTEIMQNQAGSGSLVLTDSAQDTYAYLERKTFVIALLGTADTAYNS